VKTNQGKEPNRWDMRIRLPDRIGGKSNTPSTFYFSYRNPNPLQRRAARNRHDSEASSFYEYYEAYIPFTRSSSSTRYERRARPA